MQHLFYHGCPQDDGTPGVNKEAELKGEKVSWQRKWCHQLAWTEEGQCVLVSAVDHGVTSSCRFFIPFFFCHKCFCWCMTEHNGEKWQWTKASLTQQTISFQNTNARVWWSWCFPSCVREKRGDFVTTTSCNWWNKSCFVFWVLCKWTLAARGNVQVILRWSNLETFSSATAETWHRGTEEILRQQLSSLKIWAKVRQQLKKTFYIFMLLLISIITCTVTL